MNSLDDDPPLVMIGHTLIRDMSYDDMRRHLDRIRAEAGKLLRDDGQSEIGGAEPRISAALRVRLRVYGKV
jgi:hypothetical protein